MFSIIKLLHYVSFIIQHINSIKIFEEQLLGSFGKCYHTFIIVIIVIDLTVKKKVGYNKESFVCLFGHYTALWQ